jgi:hypothetical protein
LVKICHQNQSLKIPKKTLKMIFAQNWPFTLIDLGGKSEQKYNMLHCFENGRMSTAIFCQFFSDLHYLLKVICQKLNRGT